MYPFVCQYLLLHITQGGSLDAENVWVFLEPRGVAQQCSLLCRSKGHPMENYWQIGLQQQQKDVSSNSKWKESTTKIMSVFRQVDSPLLSVVQTTFCYTMFLLPTELQDAAPSPPSSSAQYVSFFLPAPGNVVHKCSGRFQHPFEDWQYECKGKENTTHTDAHTTSSGWAV